MPDLLLFAPESVAHKKLVQLAERKGYRVRETSDRKLANQWLEARRFDVALVHAEMEINHQQEMAGRLWKLNPAAIFAVFDLENDQLQREPEVRLFGAQLATGPKAIERIEMLLKQHERVVDRELFRVMVVEDLDSPRDIICAYLEGLGYPAVEGKNSARQAMRELESDPAKYSCIITDMKMPELSGRDLIEFVRRHEKLQHLPIIVLTAYGTADALIDCLRAGASGFLVKPPKKADLTRELARAARIMSKDESPRLANPHDADKLREVLLNKGLV